MKAGALQFWHDYLDQLTDDQDPPETAASIFSFGDSLEMGDELARLVRKGIKTATCSALWSYEEAGEALPQAGEFSIVLDGSGVPVAIIETVEVFVVPFDEVSERFAHQEGEGDRSLAYWRAAHRNFFGRQSFKDRTFDEGMPLVCVRFKMVHAAP